jgi:hypothetical protein
MFEIGTVPDIWTLGPELNEADVPVAFPPPDSAAA